MKNLILKRNTLQCLLPLYAILSRISVSFLLLYHETNIARVNVSRTITSEKKRVVSNDTNLKRNKRHFKGEEKMWKWWKNCKKLLRWKVCVRRSRYRKKKFTVTAFMALGHSQNVNNSENITLVSYRICSVIVLVLLFPKRGIMILSYNEKCELQRINATNDPR